LALNDINVKYWELIHGSNKGYHKVDDYSAKCDICGDSQFSKSKKRLHLYTKATYDEDSIACFNCGYKGNMFSYIRTHHPEFYDAYKAERGYSSLNSLANQMQVVKKVQKQNTLYTFEPPEGFILNDKKSLDYIHSRKVHLSEVYYCDGMITLKDKRVSLKDYLIIPLKENDKWYGFYSRCLSSKTFYTYIPEENTGYKIWNWFNISKKTTVYVFEAIFNALSTNLTNTIACMGSDIPEDRLKELTDVVFIFDNDRTGIEKSVKYAKLGYKVMLYPSDIQEKDLNDLLKGGWSKDDLTELVKNNTYQGFEAVIELTMKL
jgi:hypothetical protein